MITADTITDEQIREAYERAPDVISIDTFDIALGRNMHAICLDRGHAVTPHERRVARARCAEILNQRAAEEGK